MKSLLCTLALFVFFIASSFAQEITIVGGEEINNPDPENFWTKQLGSDATGHYLLREYGPVTNKKVVLEKYDLDFNLLYSKDIEASSGILGDSKNHFETLLGNNEILLFLASWKKATSESGLWVQRLNLNGEKVGEEVELLVEKGATFLKSSSYKMALSPNGLKLAVLEEPTFDKSAKESISITLFNTSDFNKQVEKQFIFDTDMKRYPRNEILINNDGVAFAFKEVKVSGKEYKYFLSSLGETSQYQEELTLNEDRINQSKLIIDQSGDLVGMGLVAEAKKYITKWQKTWQMKANKAGVIMSATKPLGSDLLSKLMSEKKAAKEGTALNYYQLKDLLENPNGGYVLLTEYLDKRKTALPAVEGQPSKYTHKFSYGGIIVLSYNDDLSRTWNSFYDKKQIFETKVENMEMGSFAYGIVDNKLILVHNYTTVYVILGNYANRYWVDDSGAKIKVKDVFGEEAAYATFVSSINLTDGSLNYKERTFNALPLGDLYKDNNFEMGMDPSFFFPSEDGISLVLRMKDEMPSKIKFSTIKVR